MYVEDLPTICILAAGRGSRLGEVSDHLNKALLPLGKKAIISRILEKFPTRCSFVVALGYRGEQVKTYLSMAHPDLNITYVDIPNWQGPGSGPGLSLLCCKPAIPGRFIFVACDTLWDGDIDLESHNDWFGVATVSAEESSRYCNFEVSAGRISAVHDKVSVSGPQYKAFVGLCHVFNTKTFWSALESTSLIKGEHQISNGVSELVARHGPHAVPVEWYDTGTAEQFATLAAHYEQFDFSKPEEAIYIVGSRVIKYFSKPEIAEHRAKRAQSRPGVFPEIAQCTNGFYWYPLQPGHTLYQGCSPHLFTGLLAFLDRELWQPVHVPVDELRAVCRKFYVDKTVERLALYEKKHPAAGKTMRVNGADLPAISDLMSRIPWDDLLDAEPVVFHGDLQFDNILFDPKSGVFTLLDWRQDFGGRTDFGDLYYDLAKLNGGLLLNYDLIKDNHFRVTHEGNGVFLDFARRSSGDTYKEILRSFVDTKGLDWNRVELMTALIYLNMSPLHAAPFDELLYALGRRMLCQVLYARDYEIDSTLYLGLSKSN